MNYNIDYRHEMGIFTIYKSICYEKGNMENYTRN